MVKLRNFRKHWFTPLALLLLGAVGALTITALFPLGVSAQESQAAEITTPAPGSTLEGSTATFAWSAGFQVEQYFLYLGRTSGANDLYGQPQGLNREVTVSGLPTDGSTIYIKMWSLLPTGWFFEVTTAQAAGQAAIGAGNLVLVKAKLKEMNELLQKLIDDYRNDVIEEDELSEGIDKLHEIKKEAMKEFPDVWGASLLQWYFRFLHLDTVLETADTLADIFTVTEAEVLSILEMAKKSKQDLEAKLPK